MSELDLTPDLQQIVGYFNEISPLTGKVRLEFCVRRRIPDSDLNSIIEAYLYPLDEEARRCLGDQPWLHMQVMGDTINPALMNYDWVLHLKKPYSGPGQTGMSEILEVHVEQARLSHV